MEEYSLIDTKLIMGGLLCYIEYLPKNGVLVGACYEGGEIFTIRIGENGFGEMVSFIKQGELFEKDLLVLPKGEGPRHILLSHNEETIYVITEYSNKIFIISNHNGKMALIDSTPDIISHHLFLKI